MSKAAEVCPENLTGHLPKPLQEPAKLWCQRMQAEHRSAMGEIAVSAAKKELLQLIACSEFAGAVVVRQWGEIRDVLEVATLKESPDLSSSEKLRAELRDSDVNTFKADLSCKYFSA